MVLDEEDLDEMPAERNLLGKFKFKFRHQILETDTYSSCLKSLLI